MKIEVVTSPGGIEAWLVEDHFVPAFAMQYGFAGGSAQDAEGRGGLAVLLSGILPEGRASDEVTFDSHSDALGQRHKFYVQRDAFCGVIETLRENRFDVASFLRGMLAQPLDPAVVEIGRQRLIARAAMRLVDPRYVAVTRWEAAAFNGHPYARPIAGTHDSLVAIDVGDVDAYRGRVLARDTLKIVAVGAISPSELGSLLDEAFGALPPAASLTPIADVAPAAGGEQLLAEMNVPQSVVVFGMGAVAVDHADYAVVLVLNHILGERLLEEIRMKRGLAHEVRSGILTWRHASVLRGSVVARNAMVGRVLNLTRHEFRRLADGDIGAGELDRAKRSLIAARAQLSMGDNNRTAARLLDGALAGLGPTYLHAQRVRIGAVSDYDARRVAWRLFDPQNLSVSIAGAPSVQAEAS